MQEKKKNILSHCLISVKIASMDQGTAEDDPTVQAIHSQEAIVADLLQQAAEAGGVVVEGQAGVVLEQGSNLSHYLENSND